MKKSIIIGILCGAISLAGGCGIQNTEPREYTMPEKEVSDDYVLTEAKELIEQIAEEKHVAPELSDGFVSKYLDMENFEELKARTREGIRITQDKAGMTEQETALWETMIENKRFSMCTVEDMQEKLDELNRILESLAEENHQTISEYVSEFGMDEQETTAFFQEQAAKYESAGFTDNTDASGDIPLY